MTSRKTLNEEMGEVSARKIPVTRGFNKFDVIGFLTLLDDVDIPPDTVFAIGYIVDERAEDGTVTKIKVIEVSLIPDRDYPQRKE
jgi:hypothetical protein